MALLALVLQILGLLTGAWGVHEVRHSLTGATTTSLAWIRAHARRARRSAHRRLGEAWARLRGRPNVRTAQVQLSATATLSSTVTATVGPRPIDPGAVSDREWLALLTEQFQGVYGHLNQLREQQTADRDLAARQVRDAVTGMEASQRADAHRGLAWIYASLVLTFAGTVLGGLA
ncbi:hypothetical protein AB1207_24100 [Kineococcus endophyticus]|uniref:Stage III sporulation protein AB n=1 Tax=Kineococcus endophyticus TaxID=1181883 RepID=A0ABV3PDW4_9ACTN